MLACYGGHEDIAKRLRAAGAEWSTVDRGGSTSLHWAVDGRNCKLILWMIQDGCPVSYFYLSVLVVCVCLLPPSSLTCLDA